MNDLLETVLENPTDATIKLIYADWLEEHNRMPEAVAWRWMAKVGWYPYVALTSQHFLGPSHISVWKTSTDLPPHGYGYGDLPLAAFAELTTLPGVGQMGAKYFSTVEDSFVNVSKALAKAYAKGKWKGKR